MDVVKREEPRRASRESRRDSVQEEAAEPQLVVSADGETDKKGEALTSTVSPSVANDSPFGRGGEPLVLPRASSLIGLTSKVQI